MLTSQFGPAGRVDLYQAFLWRVVKVLRPDGILGIIVSNRFMTTKCGSPVREYILKLYDVLHVWDLGDTRLFEAAVLPSVLLLERKDAPNVGLKPKFTSIYTTSGTDVAKPCRDAMPALSDNAVVQAHAGERFLVQQGAPEHGATPDGVRRIANGNNDAWQATGAERTFLTFGQIGKAGVRIKTTADKHISNLRNQK